MGRKKARSTVSLSRREFGKQFALLGGAAITGPIAATATAGAEAGHHELALQSGTVLQGLSTESRVRFESMWQNVLRKHGTRLTDDQKARMRKIIAGNVKMLESVYAVPLANGDTPATTLRLELGTKDRRPAPAATAPATRKPAVGEK